MHFKKPIPYSKFTTDSSNEKNLKNRRDFLKAGLSLTGFAAASSFATPLIAAEASTTLPKWSQYLGNSVDKFPYGMPSPHESEVVRRSVEWLTATRESSINFTPIHALDGIITPNGLCFERHHSGAPEIPASDHQLMINGLVDQPLMFSMEDIVRFPPETKTFFLECAANGGMEWRGAQLNGCQYTHGMIHCVQYTGVRLKTLLNECGIKTKGKWILAEGADAAGMTRSIPMDKALDDCFVAYSMNGERLRTEQGYPLRLVVPGWEGNMWIKWLRRIEVGDQPWHHREETSKYTDLLENGKAREFTWVMDTKSVITSPSPENAIRRGGRQLIKGIAWSGRGAVKRVDVSLDGGRNWVTARLDTPVLSKSLTRFYLDWNWDGEEVLLQSRAMDEFGYVQPQPSVLHKERGVNSVYHNNGIQTWLVNKNGDVENVRLG
jgi:sulfane dehydrogenase subunit SoxC